MLVCHSKIKQSYHLTHRYSGYMEEQYNYIQMSQRSAATDLKRGGKFYSSFYTVSGKKRGQSILGITLTNLDTVS